MKINYIKKVSLSRDDIIKQYCTWKKVLHIGACDSPYTEKKFNWEIGPLLYKEIDTVCSEQLWVDIDKKSIDFLNSFKHIFKNSHILHTDMNTLSDLDFKPDIIVMWEVIEHLMNLEIALTNIKKVMNKNTLLIISTPNCHGLQHILTSFLRYEILHEDHKVYFSFWYLTNLMKFNGIKLQDFYFTELDVFPIKRISIWAKLSGVFMFFLQRIFYYNRGTLLFIGKKSN